jgi:signal transduction histidine kinase
VRVDDYSSLDDELAGRLRAVGIRSAVGAPIVVAGRLWGAVIAADARPYHLPDNAEMRISSFAQLLTDALANTDAREQLAASRARILKAGDEERRRVGRDLHDGAQQRLVSVVIDLQLAQKRWEQDPERARSLVDDALDHAKAAIGDLRELAAGIHPSVLTDRGLPAAIETLAARTPVPVEIDAALEERLPSSIETTAYFVVAEALTNVGKYARASRASVGVRVVGDELEIEVLDDGVGGADPAAGSGLRGLADRVSALQGALQVASPPGRGTRVHARIALS